MIPNCTRCQGLVVWDFDEALGQPATRCIQCGHRPMNPPSRDPIPHGLCKPKLGDLTHCECGKEKVEWRQMCIDCSNRSLEYYRRKRELEKLSRERRAKKAQKEMQA